MRGIDNKAIEIVSALPPTIERFPWAGHLGLRMVPEVVRAIESARSTLVFTNVFQISMRAYAPFLFVGLIVWQFFTESVLQGCNSFQLGGTYLVELIKYAGHWAAYLAAVPVIGYGLYRYYRYLKRRELAGMVDPYSYRDRLLQPKLILLATNDPYWPLDALNVYWNGLPEPKRVLYLPNQTHGLRDVDRLIGSLAALNRYAEEGKALPEVSGAFTQRNGRLELTVRTDRTPARVLAWSALSATRDFRQARWTSRRCSRSGGLYECEARTPDDAYAALYAEAVFHDRGEHGFSLSTTVHISSGPQADHRTASSRRAMAVV